MQAIEEGAKRRAVCYPTLRESITAAETLLRNIAPDLKSQEIGDIPGGEPVGVQKHEPASLEAWQKFAKALEPADG